MSRYGGLKDNIYVISAIIYVGAMFPLYYLYQAYPLSRYQIIPNYTRKLRDDVGMATPLWEILFRSIEEVDGGSQIT
ncbi:MAG: hypothetical protein ACHQ03_12150, partial [Candidatus Bathyarchaeia archaeon]